MGSAVTELVCTLEVTDGGTSSLGNIFLKCLTVMSARLAVAIGKEFCCTLEKKQKMADLVVVVNRNRYDSKKQHWKV
jgi:hypothetical protein